MKDEIVTVAVILAVLTTVLSIIGGCIVSDILVVRLIERGTDPIKATCAIKGMSDGAKATICMEAAKK